MGGLSARIGIIGSLFVCVGGRGQCAAMPVDKKKEALISPVRFSTC